MFDRMNYKVERATCGGNTNSIGGKSLVGCWRGSFSQPPHLSFLGACPGVQEGN